jgi:hypothetical protein
MRWRFDKPRLTGHRRQHRCPDAVGVSGGGLPWEEDEQKLTPRLSALGWKRRAQAADEARARLRLEIRMRVKMRIGKERWWRKRREHSAVPCS